MGFEKGDRLVFLAIPDIHVGGATGKSFKKKKKIHRLSNDSSWHTGKNLYIYIVDPSSDAVVYHVFEDTLRTEEP